MILCISHIHTRTQQEQEQFLAFIRMEYPMVEYWQHEVTYKMLNEYLQLNVSFHHIPKHYHLTKPIS